MSKGQPYHHVRFRWWGPLDIEGLQPEFGKDYEVKLVLPPVDKTRISIQADYVKELRVWSDTLTAFMSPFRAVMAQKERAPFTKRDMELRSRVFELYPRSRPTPFPWDVSSEPKFEVADER